MARTRMRAKIPSLQEAFTGHFDDHHRFLLTQMLGRIDGIDADIAVLDAQIEAHLAVSPHRRRVWMRSPASDPSPPLSSSPKSALT